MEHKLSNKTPNFDKALNEILDNLKPHQKTCQQCEGLFDIFQEDIEFYKKLRVPPPKLCPLCRIQRRMGFYNRILKLYKRPCKVPGHTEKLISIYTPIVKFPVYDFDFWWSDKWGPLGYGRDFDFQSPFFKQFQELNLSIPHSAITRDPKSIDCEYTTVGIESKHCYYVASPLYSENVYYGYLVINCKDCFEVSSLNECELCYEVIDSKSCYNCKFCQDCDSCLDSYFLYDCRNCQNCFGCFNLRNKSYCFFNQQLSKEEYRTKIKQINLGNRDTLNQYKLKFEDFIKGAIRRSVRTKNVSNCLGDDLRNCRDCFMTTRLTECEKTRYTVHAEYVKEVMDFSFGSRSNYCYESCITVSSSNVIGSYSCRESSFLEYCFECRNCHNCFGCVGLRNKKYCILNKQYSEEEYYRLLDEVKNKLLKDGEYGEFFPLSVSLHPYNDTIAIIEFPLAREEVQKRGWQWYDEPKIPPDLMGLELIEVKDLPKDIKDVKDDILNKAIICEITGKPFRIIKPELDFYRKHNLSISNKHPYQRMLERFQKRNPAKLWKTICQKCQKEMFTSYPPEKQKELKIYCETCYLKEVV